MEVNLTFEISFEKALSRLAADLTRGTLTIRQGSRYIWGDEISGIPWTWVDFLEYLSNSWVPLLVEEADPIGLDVLPRRLWDEARRRWRRLAPELRDAEERALYEFNHNHDLANALAGAEPPRCFLLRQGATILVDAEGLFPFSVSYDSLMTSLEQLGEKIAAQLVSSEDPRARQALHSWSERARVDEARFVRFATGLTAKQISAIESEAKKDVWGLSALDSGWLESDDLGAFHSSTNEQLCAARMLGAEAPPSTVSAVLEWISSRGSNKTVDLDRLSHEARRALASVHRRAPYEQGLRVASYIRELLAKGLTDDRVDPETLLVRLGVGIEARDLGFGGIDAVAVWGPAHGPAIMVNSAGRHAQTDEGKRATLAHEFCHLLVDREETLPMAEVLGGRAPRNVEARANAFAAELLLPRATAGLVLSRTKTLAEAVLAVDELRRQYGVGRQLIAWQAVRGGLRIRSAVVQALSKFVPVDERSRFIQAGQETTS